MATLTGTKVKDTYDSLLKIKDNDSLTGSRKKITDGLGNETPLSISNAEVVSTVNVEASGFKTPTGTSTEYLMADGTTSGAITGDLTYYHNQGVPSSVWTVNHNMNKFPSVVAVDSAASIVIGEVEYTTLNTITITFNSAFSGDAHLN
jgi:hypothetical protein